MDDVADVSDQVIETVVQLARSVDENFLDLARLLRTLIETDTEQFQYVVEKSKLGRRKAYYLVAIDKAFRKLQVPKALLQSIGWTKLNVLSKHINKSNANELLKMAKQLTTRDLELTLNGQQPITNAHCVLLYFTPEQYDTFQAALLQNGAERSGRGLLNKEEALINILKAN